MFLLVHCGYYGNGFVYAVLATVANQTPSGSPFPEKGVEKIHMADFEAML